MTKKKSPASAKSSLVQRSTAVARPAIERGINLDVRGTALIAQANARISVHERAAEAMAKDLKAIPGEPLGDLSVDFTRRQRRTQLTRSLAAHQDHARFLGFVRDHIERDRLYRVTLTDMSILEITPKGSLL